MKYGIALVMALTLNAVANLMMKLGANRLNSSPPHFKGGIASLVEIALANWVLLLGLCFFAGHVVLYTFALKGIPISTAYPIMVGTGFVIISIGAWKMLGERLSAMQWAGVGLILFGVWLVAREIATPPPAAAHAIQSSPTASEERHV
jgi:small multidrug resistance pump